MVIIAWYDHVSHDRHIQTIQTHDPFQPMTSMQFLCQPDFP